MKKVYQDTVQMAVIQEKHVAEIRKLKKKTFKREGARKEQAKWFVEEKDYVGLVGWMRTLIG